VRRTYHFEKLSEEELDFAERVFRSVIEAKRAEQLEPVKLKYKPRDGPAHDSPRRILASSRFGSSR
jgi:hypothetical protein